MGKQKHNKVPRGQRGKAHWVVTTPELQRELEVLTPEQRGRVFEAGLAHYDPWPAISPQEAWNVIERSAKKMGLKKK
jgi:hypothetical protein